MSDQGPTVFNDRYELHRKLARGGMSDVYLARDLLLDRPVAVKVLFPEYAKDETFVERFRREAQAAANLNHPNIVAIYDWGQQSGTYFIVMEYVEGRSLSEIIRTDGPLHPRRAAEITADVAAALGFAHRNGVVHRDVKPGNILISPSGQVKVADFGIAQAITGGRRPVQPHPGRRGHGHRHLLLARAGPGQAGRSPQRPLLARAACCSRCSPAGRRSAATRRWPSPTSTCRSPRRCPAPSGIAVPTAARGHRRASCWPRTRPTATPRPRTCAPTCATTSRACPVAACGSAAALAAGVAVGAARRRRRRRPPPRPCPSVAPPPVVADAARPARCRPPPATRPPAHADQPAEGPQLRVPVGAARAPAGRSPSVCSSSAPSSTSQRPTQVEVPSVVNQPVDDATVHPRRTQGFQVDAKTEPNNDVQGGHRLRPEPQRRTPRPTRARPWSSPSAPGWARPRCRRSPGSPRRRPRRCSRTAASSSTQSTRTIPRSPSAPSSRRTRPAGSRPTRARRSPSTCRAVRPPWPSPTCRGQSAARPRPRSPQAGFKVNETQQSSTSVDAGKVIGTNPTPGAQVAPGLGGHHHRVDRPAGHHDHLHHRHRRRRPTPPPPRRAGPPAPTP